MILKKKKLKNKSFVNNKFIKREIIINLPFLLNKY